ncbi:MAG: hypothetical protein R2845_11315 [Thermomicrobiales bacterium]
MPHIDARLNNRPMQRIDEGVEAALDVAKPFLIGGGLRPSEVVRSQIFPQNQTMAIWDAWRPNFASICASVR